MNIIRFIAAFLIYAVIDVGWNLSPLARGMYESLYEASGNDALFSAYGKQPDTWGGVEVIAILAFFLLIALANSCLAIEPAVRESSLARAVRNSFVLGCAAYATYVVPIYMMTKTWPGSLVPIDILIGGVLSLITSSAVTYVSLRLRRRNT